MLQGIIAAPTASETQARKVPSSSGAFIVVAVVALGGLGTVT
jgi:hypothetical protein